MPQKRRFPPYGGRNIILGGLFMHKKFTFGLIALLGASLFILGCDDSSDDSTQAAEQAAQELEASFGEGEAKAVGTKVTLLKAATAKDDLIVGKGVTLDVGTYTLTVEGDISGEGTVVATTGSVSLANTDATKNTANLVWALGKSGTGKIEKLTLATDATLATAAEVKAGLALTVAANTTLTVNAGVVLTVAEDGAIILTGDSTPANVAQLVLAAKVDSTAADGGGGKLVLDGVTGTLGSSGAIEAVQGNAHLVATGGISGGEFTFTGAAAGLGTAGITSISTTAAPFSSIIAATATSATEGTNSKVIFKAGASGEVTINKATTAQSAT
jgi:hypothetical protein